MDLFKPVYRFLVTPFLDFVFPPLCISCNQLLPDSSQRVCDQCWSTIERVTRDHPLYVETRTKLTDSGVVTDLVSQFVFQKEGAFQHIAHALKYSGYESIGRELGRRIGCTMNEWGVSADGLIPIPLHKAKKRERGYNQAERIAQGIAQTTGIPLQTNLVRRKKHTQTQTQLNLDQRRTNMEEAFEVPASATPLVQGRTFIVVDDVITTGATIESCAQELKRAGASRIIAASAALAQ